MAEASSNCSSYPAHARRSGTPAYKPTGKRWLTIAVLGSLLCARPCEGNAAVQRLVRSQNDISSEAVLHAEDSATLDTAWPLKPHVVQIFYESLCIDSAKLIADTDGGLWTSYNQKKHEWRFDLYPYGNAHKDHLNQTICQHGNEECKGNLVHQCALRTLNQTEAFVLIDCLMDTAAKAIEKVQGMINGAYASALVQVDADGEVNSSWVYNQADAREHIAYKDDVADVCFTKLHQPRWKTLVEQCIYDSELSYNALTHFALETQRVNFQWVPAVFFNGTYNDAASRGHSLLSYLN